METDAQIFWGFQGEGKRKGGPTSKGRKSLIRVWGGGGFGPRVTGYRYFKSVYSHSAQMDAESIDSRLFLGFGF